MADNKKRVLSPCKGEKKEEKNTSSYCWICCRVKKIPEGGKKKMPSSRIELETFGCQSCFQECHMKGYETDVMTKLDHEGNH
ncbi:hypothetical protein N7530_002033 [Penicillium desertorum]|uniref:Uncharacterized protein n=1 Tax=Penicillium desertorum TaxID=1303715 RepID=A0A9W9XB19_9EURO|nr:hypothetical protein N7530_002033 [Penicillium desertorum]